MTSQYDRLYSNSRYYFTSKLNLPVLKWQLQIHISEYFQVLIHVFYSSSHSSSFPFKRVSLWVFEQHWSSTLGSISIIELILWLRGYNSLDLHLTCHRTQTLYIFPETYLICFLKSGTNTKNLSLTSTEPNHRTLMSESHICTPATHPEHLRVPLMQQIKLHNPGRNFPSKCICRFKWAACNTVGLNGTVLNKWYKIWIGRETEFN